LASLKLKETARTLNSLAATRAYQKRDAEALVLYKRALDLDPRNYIILMNLGDSSRREGLGEKAAAYYRQGGDLASAELQNDPKNGRTRAIFGYFAGQLGDHSRSEQEIEQALQFAPHDKIVRRLAIVAYEMRGRR